MTTVIFKSEKKAKAYELKSVKDQGVYKKDELVKKIKTDDIEKCLKNNQYEYYAVEIKIG